MIERINRQLNIINLQVKRVEQLSSTIGFDSPLVASYISSIQSIILLNSNFFDAFLELLTHEQIQLVFKNTNRLIRQLADKIKDYSGLLNQKSEKDKKVNIQAFAHSCLTCGENIHENNIKMAKLYLEEENRQKFHITVEQFNKIANQPLFTPEENLDFEQKLYYQLSQKQKILGTNCSRIEEYADVMETALAHLLKLKDLELPDKENDQNSEDYLGANKISEKVSNFLHKSFSQKIPTWIHKIFQNMIRMFLQQKRAKEVEVGTQTSSKYILYEGVQISEIIRQKRDLQKLNKQLTAELQELKSCYKKLEQINAQHANTIGSSSKYKLKLPTNAFNSPRQGRSRRNSKNIKNAKIDSADRDKSVLLDNTQNIKDQSQEEQSEQTGGRNKRLKLKSILPQIKRNKYEIPLSSINNKADRDSGKIGTQATNDERKSVAGKNMDMKKYPGQDKVGEDEDQQIDSMMQQKDRQEEISKQNQKQSLAQKSQKKIKDIRKKNIGKQNAEQKQSDGKGNRKIKGKQTDKIESEIRQQITKTDKNLQSIYTKKKMQNDSELNKKKRKGNEQKQKKEFTETNSKRAGENQHQNIEDNTLKQLYDYIGKIKLNKNLKNGDLSMNQASNKDDPDNGCKLQGQATKNQSVELAILKKISKDLSKKTSQKRSQIFQELGLYENGQSGLQSKRIYDGNGEKITKVSSGHDKGDNTQINKKQGQIIKLEVERKTEPNRHLHKRIESGSNTKKLKERHRQSQHLNKMDMKSFANIERTAGKSQSLILPNRQVSRQIYDLLKNKDIIQKSINYIQFENILLNGTINQGLAENSLHQTNRVSLQESGLRKNSINEDYHPQENEKIESNNIYQNLFISKGIAHKYQDSMIKCYHKKMLKFLCEKEQDFCYDFYTRLSEVRKENREAYSYFCSLLRYPYQIIFNNLEVVNFLGEMSYDTFEYFFRKIAWIHRKCRKMEGGVCQHIEFAKKNLNNIFAHH